MESENEIKTNKDVELKEYKVISQFLETNDEGETAKAVDLPTPESLEKLCSIQIVKDVLTYDINKYKSFLEENDGKTILNLDKIDLIKNNHLLPYILIFIGGINSKSDIYRYFDESIRNPDDKYLLDHSINYLDYLNNLIDFLKDSDKMNVCFPEVDLFFQILEELGINIHKEEKNVLYKSFKDAFLSLAKNKILLIIAPSNNFWIKSPKSCINDQNYDIKLNNYNNIFYNKKFIQKFLAKITNIRDVSSVFYVQ